jgi:hypothetical protein
VPEFRALNLVRAHSLPKAEENMERRRFFTAIGLLFPSWRFLFSGELPRAVAAPSEGPRNVPAAAGAGFLAVLGLLVPLAEKVLDKIFGKSASDDKSVKKKDAKTTLDGFTKELQTSVGSVNDDVKFLTAWRKTASSFDGATAIKDSLIQIGMLVDSAERFSDSGLVASKDDVIRMVEEATFRITEIVKSGSLEQLPEVDIFDARSAAGKVASKLKFVADHVRQIQKTAEPVPIRQTFAQLGAVVQEGIASCEDISLRHEEYQIRLSNDFLDYMKKFDVQPNKDVEDASKSKRGKTLGDKRIPLEQAPGVLQGMVAALGVT